VDKKSLKKAIDFWLRSAKQNFEAAKVMLKTGQYSLAMFMCQQAVESLLKGVFIVYRQDRPPYVHKLPRLLELTGTKVPKSIDLKILKIDAHYIKARYKEDRFNPKIYNRKNAQKLIKETQETLKWFIENLNLNQ